MADKKVLFVVNMQEFYVGRNRDKSCTYPVDRLIEGVNARIKEYEAENVYYIVTVKKGLFGAPAPKEGSAEAGFIPKLKIVSRNIYQKNKPDAFTSSVLEDACRARMIKEIEMVGVDAVDVYSTAVGAIDCGMRVIFNDNCIFAADMAKSQKAAEGIDQSKVEYI